MTRFVLGHEDLVMQSILVAMFAMYTIKMCVHCFLDLRELSLLLNVWLPTCKLVN